MSWLGAFLSNIEVEHAVIALLVALAAAALGAVVQTRHSQQQQIIAEINVKVNGQLTRLRAALERAIAMLPEEKALAAIAPDEPPEPPAGA